MSKHASRREFLRLAATSPVALAAGPVLAGSQTFDLSRPTGAPKISPNDPIRVATIGMAGMGFGDTRTAHKVEGVEFVASADAYDGRLVRAKESFGIDVFTTRDYREILSRSDVDAVLAIRGRQLAVDAAFTSALQKVLETGIARVEVR